jgi:hypothetical protein
VVVGRIEVFDPTDKLGARGAIMIITLGSVTPYISTTRANIIVGCEVELGY